MLHWHVEEYTNWLNTFSEPNGYRVQTCRKGRQEKHHAFTVGPEDFRTAGLNGSELSLQKSTSYCRNESELNTSKFATELDYTKNNIHLRRENIGTGFHDGLKIQKSGITSLKGKMKSLPFQKQYYVVRYEINDESPRRFSCDECGKRFKHRHHLQYHERQHSGIKPYECDVCQKSFSQLSNMYSHRRRHGLEIKCDACGKQFHKLDKLKYHVCDLTVVMKEETKLKWCQRFLSSVKLVYCKCNKITENKSLFCVGNLE